MNIYLNNLSNFNVYNLIYFFAFYSFGGWCLEVSYYFKNEHRFVNRGFLKGPFCPIYGSTIVLLIIFLDSYKNNLFLLFCLAFFITSALEYITGFFLEKIFKAKWWDYTDDPFNIHGRVCLLYSLFWASGEILIIKFIHPLVASLINNIPYFLNSLLFFALITYFSVDFCFTLVNLMQSHTQFPPIAFAFSNLQISKNNFLTGSNKEKAISAFERFKLNNKNKGFFRNFYSFHNISLNSIFKTLKNKLKRD